MDWPLVTGLPGIATLQSRLSAVTSSNLAVTRQIAGATIAVAVTTALVAIVTIPRELLIAARFGTGDVADAYLVALVVPTFVLGVLGGSVASAFIPAYLRVREQDGPAAGDRLLGELTLVLLVLLGVVSILVGLCSPYLLRVMASGFTDSKLATTQQALLVLLTTVPVGGVSALWAAALNAKGMFALPSLSQGAIPVAGIGALLVFPEAGLEALTSGMVAGFVVRLLVLAWALRRAGTPLRPVWRGFSEDSQRVARQYAPMAVASVLMGGTTLVDQAVAASLGAGSVATLGYGLKFITLGAGLGSIALGTAVLPFLSRMVATSDWQQLRTTVRTFSLLALAATLPVAVATSVLAVPLVALIYERGAFSPADTIAVAQVLALGVLQLPFLAAGVVFARLVSSLGANQLLLVQSAIMLGLNTILDVVLARHMGASGIALATSVMYACSLLILMIAARIAMRRVS
ncbi:MAG: lipid II flippase MurJ [Thermomicrobiales bacterium]